MFAQLSQQGNKPTSASERRVSSEADGADGADGVDPRIVSFIRPSSSREDGEDGGVENSSCQETSAGKTWTN